MAKEKAKAKKTIEEIEENKKEETKKEKIKPKKKKMTAADKRRLGMQITGWIMALIMIAGVVMTFLSFFAN